MTPARVQPVEDSGSSRAAGTITKTIVAPPTSYTTQRSFCGDDNRPCSAYKTHHTHTKVWSWTGQTLETLFFLKFLTSAHVHKHHEHRSGRKARANYTETVDWSNTRPPTMESKHARMVVWRVGQTPNYQKDMLGAHTLFTEQTPMQAKHTTHGCVVVSQTLVTNSTWHVYNKWLSRGKVQTPASRKNTSRVLTSWWQVKHQCPNSVLQLNKLWFSDLIKH